LTFAIAISSLTDIAAYDFGEAALTGAGEARHVNVSHVNASLFPILGVQAYLGRTFTPEDQPGRYLAVLSYKFWHTYLNGNRGVIGRSFSLNGRAYTVVGSCPRAFNSQFRRMRGAMVDYGCPGGN
jgi:hypothetical protein